jgi:uncharacterized protein YjiS (DUF1127 family)
MLHTFDFDRYLRDYQTLTAGQRDALVRRVLREAQTDRAEAMRGVFRALGRGAWKAVVWGFARLRPVWAAASRPAAAAWQSYDRRRRLRATAAQLYAMDERELKDIGLNRGDIAFVLSGIKDPTRRARTGRPAQDPRRCIDSAKPSRGPVQRAGAPLLLRNECAG